MIISQVAKEEFETPLRVVEIEFKTFDLMHPWDMSRCTTAGEDSFRIPGAGLQSVGSEKGDWQKRNVRHSAHFIWIHAERRNIMVVDCVVFCLKTKELQRNISEAFFVY